MEHTRIRKKLHHKMSDESRGKLKRRSSHQESLHTSALIKKIKLSDTDSGHHCTFKDEGKHTGQSVSLPDPDGLMLSVGDSWEVDSGFSSETSPPDSGRSSPCLSSCPTSVVALDCEMVGTGPGGSCSELARCSIVDYHGNVLYDNYVRPSQRVTDFRTPWSGIHKHHLLKARPFAQARDEIQSILEGKVVVGHSVYNDFEVLGMVHPGHMVRDTSTSNLLGRLAGFHDGRCSSLKVLASKLLNRKIQTGKKGHCSVEDALTSLDLYKLVEGEWEKELQSKLRGDDTPSLPSFASSDHYMKDEYWPEQVTQHSQ